MTLEYTPTSPHARELTASHYFFGSPVIKFFFIKQALSFNVVSSPNEYQVLRRWWHALIDLKYS